MIEISDTYMGRATRMEGRTTDYAQYVYWLCYSVASFLYLIGMVHNVLAHGRDTSTVVNHDFSGSFHTTLSNTTVEGMAVTVRNEANFEPSR